MKNEENNIKWNSFKCLFSNENRALIFELGEGTIYDFVKFNYQSYKWASIEKSLHKKGLKAHQINDLKGPEIYT